MFRFFVTEDYNATGGPSKLRLKIVVYDKEEQ